MSIYRRGDRWWVKIQIAGVTTRRSAQTTDRREAELYEQRLRTSQFAEIKLGDRSQTAFKKAAARWLRDANVPGKKNNNQVYADWFCNQPLIGEAPLASFDQEAIEEMRESLEEGFPGRRVIRGGRECIITEERALSTVDRYMGVFRAIMKTAEDLKWIEKAPKVPMHDEATAEAVWLTREAFDALVVQLPPHLALCAQFAVLTGVRMRAMLSLTWDKVDLKNQRAWIPGRVQKNGDPLGLPLSREVCKVLMKARTYCPKGNHVFQYKPHSGLHAESQPIDDCNTAAFTKACERAKLYNVRWHSFRHTFAAWAVQAGVRLERLMELGGWRSYKSVLRYKHLAPDHLRQDAELVAGDQPMLAHSKYIVRRRKGAINEGG